MQLLPKTIDTFGIWTQYTGFCFYQPHDILLKNGMMLLSMLPSELGWLCTGPDRDTWELFTTYCEENQSTHILNKDVVAVKLLADKDIEDRMLSWCTGAARLEQIKNTHGGEGIEHVILQRNRLLKDHQIREAVNQTRNIAAKYGATQQLRSHVEEMFKDTFKDLFYNQS